MMQSADTFHIHLRRGNRTLVDRRSVITLPAVYEDLRFRAVLQGCVPNDGVLPDAAMASCWQEGRFTGIAASLGSFSRRYLPAVFRYDYWDILRANGVLEEEKENRARYRLELLVERGAGRPIAKSSVPSRVESRAYPIEDRPLAGFGIAAAPVGPPFPALFVSSCLLEELREATRCSPDRERVDLLCGHLVRSGERGAAVVLTARHPVPDAASSSATHFAISPTALMRALASHRISGQGTVPCGWHHNHPNAVAEHTRGGSSAVRKSPVFLSLDDHLVFRALFPFAYAVGLVSGEEETGAGRGIVVKAFGWRDALVEQIPMQVF